MKKNFLTQTMALLLASILILAASSCKKDDEEKTNTDKLTGKNFVMSGWTIDPPVTIQGTSFADLWSFLPECTKDDFMVFNADGTVTFDEGATKCDPGDPQTDQGTWTYVDNETKISVTADGETDVMEIVELTDSTLKVSFEETEDFGDGEKTYTNTITYTAN